MKHFLIFLSIFILSSMNAICQLSINTDLKSLYVWRGIELGNSTNLQPALAYKYNNLNFGTRGVYMLANSSNTYSEIDFWLMYDVPLSTGTFSLIFTDLFFPYMNIKFFNMEGSGTGAHTLEAGIQYAGPRQVPLNVRAFVNVHNDPENSTYFEFEYPFNIDSILLTTFAGFSTKKSAVYRINNAGVIYVGLTATKILAITESFSIPISTSFIINPYLEQSFIVFGVVI
jgi:hypothetical protein